MKEKEDLWGESFLFAFLVLVIGSIVRLGASIYLPAMPIIAEEMHISTAKMSNTLTVYFIVFASFTLLSGMLSDAYGRKKVLLAGMGFFLLGAVLCGLSESYEMLMFGRVVQAFGASMVPGTLMAMIRDACSDIKVVSLMGWLTVLGGLFLVAAPVVGGLLTHLWGWSSNFWFLGFFTFTVWLGTLLYMQETHPESVRAVFSPGETLANASSMLRSASFTLVLLPVMAFYAIQGAFLAAVPFIVMGEYGLDPVRFGLSNITVVAGLFAGRYVGMFLLRRYGNQAVYRYGALAGVTLSLLFLLMAQGYLSGLMNFLLLAGIFAALFGMLAPLGMKSSLTAFREVSGIAAAIQSALLFAASALGSALVGLLVHQLPFLSVESVFAWVTAVLLLFAAAAALKGKTLL